MGIVGVWFLLLFLVPGYSPVKVDNTCVQSRLAVKTGDKKLLQCTGVGPSDLVTWHYGSNTKPDEIGNCPEYSVNGTTCTQDRRSKWTLSREETSSTLTFPSVAMPTHGLPGDVAICKVGAVEKKRWLLDIYSNPTKKISSPVWQPSKGKVISGSIQVVNFTSSQGCYSCQWYQEVNGMNKTPITTTRDIQEVGTTGLRNITCSFTLPVPSVSATYTYTFDFPQVFTQPYPYGLRHPPPPEHNCPVFVQEGGDLRCTCIPKDRGVPVREFLWLGTLEPNMTLHVANVSRNHHRTVYTCADESGYSLVNYTLRVTYGPSQVFIAATKSLKDPNGLALVCLAQDCSPSPTLTWTTSTGQSLGQGPWLEVDRSHLHEGWEVRCEASNSELGNSKVIGSINVLQVLRQLNYSLAWEVSLESHKTSFGKGVVTGVGVMLALLLLGTLTVLLVVRLRRRSLRTLGKKSKSKTGEERRVHLVDITSLCPFRSRDGDQSPEVIPTDRRGLPEGASNYDALDGTQAKAVYPYSSLVMGASSDKGQHSLTEPQPQSDVKQTEDPLYANTKQVLEEDSELPIYANS